MSDKTKDSLLVISDNFRLTVRDFFLTARLGGHRTVRTARARHGGVRQRRDRHFLPPTFRDEQLSSLGTSRFFLGTSVRPYGRTVSRTYVQKNCMSDKTKDSLLVISDNFRLKVHDFFFDGTFTLAPYCSYGPLRELGGSTFRSNKVAQ